MDGCVLEQHGVAEHRGLLHLLLTHHCGGKGGVEELSPPRGTHCIIKERRGGDGGGVRGREETGGGNREDEEGKKGVQRVRLC